VDHVQSLGPGEVLRHTFIGHRVDEHGASNWEPALTMSATGKWK
jgi:hypothetical protein